MPIIRSRQTAAAASGFCMNVEVEVFSAMVGLLVTNKPTTAWFGVYLNPMQILLFAFSFLSAMM
jgi:hypothetical protein